MIEFIGRVFWIGDSLAVVIPAKQAEVEKVEIGTYIHLKGRVVSHERARRDRDSKKDKHL